MSWHYQLVRHTEPEGKVWYGVHKNYSGSLDAFADMCRLRCKEDTQYESRIVADQISGDMTALFPVAWKALTDDVES